jgi:hypothetical protein
MDIIIHAKNYDYSSAPILEGIANNISAGCGSSFSNTPLPPALSLITTFKNDYPVIREMMCLQK